MSRSHKHTPKRSYGSSASEKTYKIIWHKMMRAAIRQRLHGGNADNVLLPHEREIFSDYDFGRSGKRWFDPEENPELMRK